MTDGPIVPRLCPGGTVVCLGGGPSLTRDDVESCRGKADIVIAINDAHRLAPWADVLYSSDQHWWPFYDGVPTFPGLKFGLDPLTPKPEWKITVLRNVGDYGLSADPSGLKSGWNSGAAAINLAVHFGAKRVLLLGYDMGHPSGSPSHWFGEHPARLQPAARLYVTYIAMLERMVIPLRQIGVTVINCSRWTQLECFQRMPIEEALATTVAVART